MGTCIFFGHSITVYDDGSGDSSEQFQSWIAAYDAPSCDARPEGDFDGNGALDGFDLAVWASIAEISDPRADLDGSGVVDVLDLLLLLDNIRSARVPGVGVLP